MGSIERIKSSSSQKKATTHQVSGGDHQHEQHVACYQATQNFLPENTQVTTEFTVSHPIVYNANVEEQSSATLNTL